MCLKGVPQAMNVFQHPLTSRVCSTVFKGTVAPQDAGLDRRRILWLNTKIWEGSLSDTHEHNSSCEKAG